MIYIGIDTSQFCGCRTSNKKWKSSDHGLKKTADRQSRTMFEAGIPKASYDVHWANHTSSADHYLCF